MKIPKEHAMLIDVRYIRPKKGQPDYLYIIWKDLRDGSKHLQAIPEPKMEIYFEKPELRDHKYNKNYQLIENLDKKIVTYKDIPFAIAEEMGESGKQRLMQALRTGDRKTIQSFYIYPYVFGADIDIRAYYRYLWEKSYANKLPKKLKKAYLDIEVDVLEANGFPNPISDPVDLVTVIDDDSNTSYTFLLIGRDRVEKDISKLTSKEAVKAELRRQRLHPQRRPQEEYYSNHPEMLEAACHEMFDESYPDMNYKFFFYHDERKMIRHVFELINYNLCPDIVEIWNMPFDMPYMRDRLIALDCDPNEIICHRDFPIKECYFKKDMINHQIKNKADWFFASSYTLYVCQMRNYAAIRKGRKELRSNKLNYVAKHELNDEKLDYSESLSLDALAYKNYLKYILYNIKDVLLQRGIERKTKDLDTFYMTSYLNCTPYENEFKQTIKLRNVQYMDYLSKGLVPGENVNGFLYNYKEEREADDYDEDDDEEENKKNKDSYEGALVGDPILNGEFGMKMFGKKSNSVYEYAVDMDMEAFYPNTIYVLNIDPSTLLFKVILDANQYDIRGGELHYNGITNVQLNSHNSDTFTGDIAKETFDNYQTGNVISTGHKWLNLPSVNQVYAEIKKRQKRNKGY